MVVEVDALWPQRLGGNRLRVVCLARARDSKHSGRGGTRDTASESLEPWITNLIRRQFAVIVLFVSGLIALAAHSVQVSQKDASLMESLGEIGMSNDDGPKVIDLRLANCERGGLNPEPVLLVADINVQGVFSEWNDLVGDAMDQLRPVGLDRSALIAEGYLELADDAQRVFIDVNPGNAGLLRVGAVTQGGSVVRANLRRLRETSDEPIAIFISGTTIEWWSREVRGRINNATPLGCTTLTIGAADGVVSAPGSVLAHLEVGDGAVALRERVNDYFRRFSSRSAISVMSLMAEMTFVATVAIIGWLRFRRAIGRMVKL